MSTVGASQLPHLPPPWPGATILSSGANPRRAGHVTYRAVWRGTDDQAMMVPYATGWVLDGAMITIVLADGTRLRPPIADFAIPNTWWSVTVPGSVIRAHGGGTITVSFDDPGNPGGHWIALAPPAIGVPDPDAARLY
jgi:hypothetical protein